MEPPDVEGAIALCLRLAETPAAAVGFVERADCLRVVAGIALKRPAPHSPDTTIQGGA